MVLDFLDQGPQLTEADLQKLEKQLGCPLPTEYRQFMILHNGGEPASLARFSHNHVIWQLEWLYTIDFAGKAASLPYAAKSMRSLVPKCLLPIGQFETAHMLAMGVFGSIRDRIFLVTDDATFKADSPAAHVARDAGVRQVADNFAAFIAGLT